MFELNTGAIDGIPEINKDDDDTRVLLVGADQDTAELIYKAISNHDTLCELLRACAMQLSIDDGAARRMDGILAKRAFELLEGME